MTRLAFVGLCVAIAPAVHAQASLCTFFGLNGGGATGGAMYFDLTVHNPAGVTVTAFDTNFSDAAGTPNVGLDVYRQPGPYLGTSWELVSSSSSSTTMGSNNPTLVDGPDFCLTPGSWSLALVAVNARHAYTNGNGTNQSHPGPDLSLLAGAASNVPFSPTFFRPRVWNGCIRYQLGATVGSDLALGPGCVNSRGLVARTLLTSGPPAIGTSLALRVIDAPQSQSYSFVLLGFVDLGGMNLASIGAPGCRLFPQPVVTLSAPTGPSGVGVANPISIRQDSALVGLTLIVQAAIADPGHNALGLVLSDARAATVGCR